VYFVIRCMDKPGVLETRLATMPAHRDYVATKPIKVLLSGPLTEDDGETIVGSFFMVEAADRAAVERFQHNDPLFKAGIWASIDVQAFAKRVDNRD
jgi:uncharacterized protein YciI